MPSSRPQALVTGTTGGVGAAIASSLAATHDVLLGGRDSDALNELAARLPGARPWQVDLGSPEVVAAATRGIDRLDVLVHAAGVCRLGPVAHTTAATWRSHFEVNVVAVAELTRLLLPALRAAHGHVVLINSGQGLRPSPGWGAYAASKFALRAFGDVLRGEEPELRVTSVFPGRTATDMQREVRAAEGGSYEPEHYLRPESVAAAVLGAISASADAHPTEVVLRPQSH